MAYTALTLADLKVLLQDRYEAVRFYTDPERRLAINETLREWNLWTGRWRRRVAYATAVNTHDYALGATLTYGMAVRVSGSPLLPCSITDLDLGHPSWRGETTATGSGVPTSPSIWAPISLQQIVIWPAPTAVVANALVVDGVSNTPVLVEDADTVDLGDESLDILLEFALHVLTFKQGGQAWAATLPSYQAFLEAAAKENGRLKANQKFRRAAGLNRRRDLQPSQNVPTQMDGLSEQIR